MSFLSIRPGQPKSGPDDIGVPSAINRKVYKPVKLGSDKGG